MTTDRAYRRALSHEAACQELRGKAGTQFDPEVVAAFVAEVARDDAPAPAEERETIDLPLQEVADRVRTLLGSARIEPCPPSPAASTAAGAPTSTPPASRPAST